MVKGIGMVKTHKISPRACGNLSVFRRNGRKTFYFAIGFAVSRAGTPRHARGSRTALKSAIKSSGSSRPTLMRTRPSEMPDAFSSPAV